MHGASSPFQFEHPVTDDFVEVEDDNGELHVICTKTAVLEDQLKKANDTLAELKQVTAHSPATSIFINYNYVDCF